MNKKQILFSIRTVTTVMKEEEACNRTERKLLHIICRVDRIYINNSAGKGLFLETPSHRLDYETPKMMTYRQVRGSISTESEV